MLTCRHVDAIGIAVCLGLAALAWQTVLRPVASRGAGLSTLEAELESTRAARAELDLRRAELERRLEQTRQRTASQQVVLASQRSLNARLADVAELVSANGMVIQETKVGAARQSRWHQTIPIKLNGRGAYLDFSRWLHDVKRQMPDVGVVAFRLSGNPRQRDVNVVFQVDLEWYAATEEAAPPS